MSQKLHLKRMSSQLVVVEAVVAEVATAVAEVEPRAVVVEVPSEVTRPVMSSRGKMTTILSTVRLQNQFETSRRRRICRWMRITILPCDEEAFIKCTPNIR